MSPLKVLKYTSAPDGIESMVAEPEFGVGAGSGVGVGVGAGSGVGVGEGKTHPGETPGWFGSPPQ